MEQSPFFFLLVLLVLTVFSYFSKQIRHKLSKYPPGPAPLPILGNFLHLSGRKPHIALANLAKTHGSLMSLQLGTKLVIIGSSQAAATEILKIHDHVLSGRPVQQTFEVFDKGSILLSFLRATECTENWKMSRALMKTELVSSKSIDSTSVLREEKVKELIDFLRTKEGKEVDVGEVVLITVVNIVCNLLFSKDFVNIDDEGMVVGIKVDINKMVKYAGLLNLGDFYPLLSRLDVQGVEKKFSECMRRMYASWDVLVDGRQESKTSDVDKEKNLVGVLFAKGFSKDQIYWFLSEIFITGTSTLIGTVEWAMAELMKNHEAMSKLCGELAKEIGGNMVRDSDLPRLTYLNACVKETLRLHPSVPVIPRRAIQTCQVMSYTIPRDAQVWVNLWALGRDPTQWEDPFTFQPSRFLKSNLDFMGSNYEYLPFGTGKRMCPGLPFAARVVPLILASLVHSFDWHLPHNTTPAELDMNEKVRMTLQREKPLLLIPKHKGN